MWCVICGYQKHDGQCCVGCVGHTENGDCVTAEEMWESDELVEDPAAVG